MTAELAVAEPRKSLRLLNAAASVLVIVVAVLFHHVAPGNRVHLDRLFGGPAFSFTGREFLVTASLLYAVAVSAYFLTMASAGRSKSLHACQLAAAFVRSPVSFVRRGVSADERLAILATLLKALFGPLMAMALMTATMGLLYNAGALIALSSEGFSFRALFDRHGFWLLFQLVVMADVVFFTVGYLVEVPRLGNQIRSVDPTLLGWAAALICYAPFNVLLGLFLGAPGSEFPRFENDAVHYSVNAMLLVLMAIYSAASVALGFKASNLTHRGIVSHGPYRLVRHPAYVCKNMAWWIGSIPTVSLAFSQSAGAGLHALGAVVGWSLLYVLRALTEEDHLRRVDGEYAAYAARVRYRFIPGVW
jgi:protein-S-isoprenylcysteine O-methyltransferase Ste14